MLNYMGRGFISEARRLCHWRLASSQDSPRKCSSAEEEAWKWGPADLLQGRTYYRLCTSVRRLNIDRHTAMIVWPGSLELFH